MVAGVVKSREGSPPLSGADVSHGDDLMILMTWRPTRSLASYLWPLSNACPWKISWNTRMDGPGWLANFHIPSCMDGYGWLNLNIRGVHGLPGCFCHLLTLRKMYVYIPQTVALCTVWLYPWISMDALMMPFSVRESQVKLCCKSLLKRNSSSTLLRPRLNGFGMTHSLSKVCLKLSSSLRTEQRKDQCCDKDCPFGVAWYGIKCV